MPQPIVPLGVKQALPFEARQLEAVVHVGGDHKIVPPPQQCQQVLIGLPHGPFVAVVINVPAPIGPVFLRCGKGVKPRRIHIGKMVLLDKIPKMPCKPRAVIQQARRSRKARPRPQNNGVGLLQGLPQLLHRRFTGCFVLAFHQNRLPSHSGALPPRLRTALLGHTR